MIFQRAKIIKCEPHDDYKLWIQFDDGMDGEVNLKDFVGKGVFSAWNSVDFFNSVYVSKKTDTVTWGEDIDLDPYVLHDQILNSRSNKPKEF